MSIYSILVDLETLKNINRFICQTSDTPDEESVVINENNLLSALSVLDSYFETKEQMAAALLRSLVIAHGFENGNKRTAFIASTMICPCKCSHQKAADITLKIAKGELKDVDMIAKQLFTLDEDLFVDVPEVEYQLDTNIELEGPEPGEDTGVAGLLLDLIGKVADNINEFNQLQPNLENYPEISEMIKDFADDENEKLGKIQSALKTISPNAELIMNGAVEAEQEMDPGSPLDEAFADVYMDGHRDILEIDDIVLHKAPGYGYPITLCKIISDYNAPQEYRLAPYNKETGSFDESSWFGAPRSEIRLASQNDIYKYESLEVCEWKLLNNIDEEYDNSTIKSYFEDVWERYSELRDSLYAFENAVSGNKDLEIAANSFIRDVEEAAGNFWTDYQYYIKSIEEIDDEI